MDKPLITDMILDAADKRRENPIPERYTKDGRVNHGGLNQEQVTEQAVQCFELRLTGASIPQIAKALHMSTATVRKRLNQHERAYLVPLTESVRKTELARYDSYLLRLQTKIAEGDVAAIATAVRISEQRRKLLGADAPVEVNNRYPDGVPNPQLDSNIARLLEEIAVND